MVIATGFILAVAAHAAPLAALRAVPPGTPADSRLRWGISKVVQDWERDGRAKTLKWYEEHPFGKTPIARPADEVIGERSVSFAGGKIRIDVTLALPEGASKDHPVPVFVFGGHGGGVPVNAITARGYAFVAWDPGEVCPKAPDGGTVAARAGGYSRVMDWIETRPELDAARVAVLGHGRDGKTALWAAAQDERFAMAVSQDAEIPADGDALVKLIAPRLVYVASVMGDASAGASAAFAATKKASLLWQAYHFKGLGLSKFPGTETFDHSGHVGYHLRSGSHALTPYDWNRYMDFADKYLKAPSTRDSEEIERRQAAAIADGSRTLVLGANPSAKDGVWRPVRAILVPDDFTLVLDGCRIEQPRGVRDNLIRNAGAAEGACRANRNVKILGCNGATLSMGSFNQYLPLRSGDPNGWRSVGILLAKVQDYELAGFRMEETQCWAISQEACSNGHLHDLEFGSTDLNANQDGIDLRKGCHDIRIERIRGSVGDDLVALTALRDAKGAPPAYGMQINGLSNCGDADDVYNVTIRDVRGKSAGGHGIIRLLLCDAIRMHHVRVEDIEETAGEKDKPTQATIRIGDTHYQRYQRCQMGDMHDITVKNVKSKGRVGVWVKGPIKDSSITGVEVREGAKAFDVTAPVENTVMERELTTPTE